MLPSASRVLFGVSDDRRDRIAALLRALDITEIQFSLDGEGDSGDCSLDVVTYADGTSEYSLPDIPVGFSSFGTVETLSAYLDDLAAELPEGDWVNNEGGYGTVTILPFEDDPSERFACEMTYRDGYADDGDDFDEVELDTHLDMDADPFAPPAIQIEGGEQ